ncbi:MAG TPA: hypothetical protein VMU88_03695 [bacterium]|nr:hypothetical protein [bacterium]
MPRRQGWIGTWAIFGLMVLLVSPALAASLTPTPTDSNANSAPGAYNSSKVLEIHKPLIPPAWGRVLQYKKEQNFVLSGHNQETLYEFVFQNDEGIVRTATYHETADGNGFWEVYVWDEP